MLMRLYPRKVIYTQKTAVAMEIKYSPVINMGFLQACLCAFQPAQSTALVLVATSHKGEL